MTSTATERRSSSLMPTEMLRSLAVVDRPLYLKGCEPYCGSPADGLGKVGVFFIGAGDSGEGSPRDKDQGAIEPRPTGLVNLFAGHIKPKINGISRYLWQALALSTEADQGQGANERSSFHLFKDNE